MKNKGDKPKSTFLFLNSLTLVLLETKDITNTFKNRQRFWKLNKNWQSYPRLTIGALVMIGVLAKFRGGGVRVEYYIQ